MSQDAYEEAYILPHPAELLITAPPPIHIPATAGRNQDCDPKGLVQEGAFGKQKILSYAAHVAVGTAEYRRGFDKECEGPC